MIIVSTIVRISIICANVCKHLHNKRVQGVDD